MSVFIVLSPWVIVALWVVVRDKRNGKTLKELQKALDDIEQLLKGHSADNDGPKLL